MGRGQGRDRDSSVLGQTQLQLKHSTGKGPDKARLKQILGRGRRLLTSSLQI